MEIRTMNEAEIERSAKRAVGQLVEMLGGAAIVRAGRFHTGGFVSRPADTRPAVMSGECILHRGLKQWMKSDSAGRT